MRTLLIGSGHIGRSTAAAMVDPPTTLAVPWDRPDAARAAIQDGVGRFLSGAGRQPWALCWAAGSGVVGTDEAELDVQLGHLRAALEAVEAAAHDVRAAGRIVLASSAGGIHAGDSGIVTEASPPSPVSAYGRHMLRQEQAATELARTTGIPCLLGRISNVYGPNQDLHKPQGFITRLCRAMQRRDGFVLLVPPDTIRDFVYGADVGRWMAAWIQAGEPRPGQAVVKLVVSGRSTTLHEVIGVVRSVARVPARITISPLGADPDQPLRTRFRSTTLLGLDRVIPTTPLAEGVHRTWLHLLRCTAAPTPRP